MCLSILFPCLRLCMKHSTRRQHLKRTLIDLLVGDQTTSYLMCMEIAPQEEKKSSLNKPQAISVVLVEGSHLSEIPKKRYGEWGAAFFFLLFFLTGRQGLVRPELYLKDLARSPQRLDFPPCQFTGLRNKGETVWIKKNLQISLRLALSAASPPQSGNGKKYGVHNLFSFNQQSTLIRACMRKLVL